MQEFLAILVLIVLCLAIVLVVPALMTRRALKQLILIFRRQGALNRESAKTVDELGLGPKSFAQRITRLRDYKPRALAVMMQTEVVVQTDEGKLFMSEEKLQASGLPMP